VGRYAHIILNGLFSFILHVHVERNQIRPVKRHTHMLQQKEEKKYRKSIGNWKEQFKSSEPLRIGFQKLNTCFEILLRYSLKP
jgi:transposase